MSVSKVTAKYQVIENKGFNKDSIQKKSKNNPITQLFKNVVDFGYKHKKAIATGVAFATAGITAATTALTAVAITGVAAGILAAGVYTSPAAIGVLSALPAAATLAPTVITPLVTPLAFGATYLALDSAGKLFGSHEQASKKENDFFDDVASVASFN